MERSTVVTLLVLIGLGGLVLWYYSKAPNIMGQAQQTVQPNMCGSTGSSDMTKVYGVPICTNLSQYGKAGKTMIKGVVTTPYEVTKGLLSGNLSSGNWRDGPVPVPKQPITPELQSALSSLSSRFGGHP